MKAVAVALIIIVATSIALPLIAKSPWGQGVREHYQRVVEDLTETWADRPPRFEELILFRAARLIVAIIDLLD